MIKRAHSTVYSPTRRRLLAAVSALAGSSLVRQAGAQMSHAIGHGESSLMLLGDGVMRLPASFILGDTVPEADRAALIDAMGVSGDTFEQPLNVTLWRNGDRTVLFDAGSGLQFLDGTGVLPGGEGAKAPSMCGCTHDGSNHNPSHR